MEIQEKEIEITTSFLHHFLCETLLFCAKMCQTPCFKIANFIVQKVSKAKEKTPKLDVSVSFLLSE